MRILFLEFLGVAVVGCPGQVHVEHRVHAVQHKGLTLRVEDQDILVLLGGPCAVVCVLASVLVEGQVERVVVGWGGL